MSNHTPGPWRVAEVNATEPGALEIRAGVFPNYLGSVALLYDVNERADNARLIAAAPQMLEALKDTLDHLRHKNHLTWGDIESIIASAIKEATA